ncbi:MAG: RNA methyltransferase [Candidatus Thermoplasmatota archaeon]|nr:RNA methyltransferase [Candidatus Thermoplasmatota archaeon]
MNFFQYILEFVPILVEPLYQGNIGSVARLARNFGMKRMILVNPPDIEDEAIAYSMHGKMLLVTAEVYGSLEEASEHVDHVIATSGISDSAEKCYRRNPNTPDEFLRWCRISSGTVGLVFGREDRGLEKEELEICDQLVTIPASPDYPILNLSHSAGILFYLIWNGLRETPRKNARSITGSEKRILLEHYDRLMEAGGVHDHKRPIARTNFRRMISRAAMNNREYNTLMGTFSRAMDYKRKKKDDHLG